MPLLHPEVFPVPNREQAFTRKLLTDSLTTVILGLGVDWKPQYPGDPAPMIRQGLALMTLGMFSPESQKDVDPSALRDLTSMIPDGSNWLQATASDAWSEEPPIEEE